LNTELFIAKRLFSGKKKEKSISSQIVTIAVASISLGLAIMLVAVSVLFGFKSQIREKIVGFSSHFQVVNFDANNSYETHPIERSPDILSDFRNTPGVEHIQFYATKPGIIKTNAQIHGIVFKGVDPQFDWSFFRENLKAGNLPQLTDTAMSNDVVVSQKVANLLNLKIEDPLYCYFYDESNKLYRNRRFNISGIYNTGFNDFDELFVMGDLRQVQLLNGWSPLQVSGFEIQVDNSDNLDAYLPNLHNITLLHASEEAMLKVTSVVERNALLFDWLSVLDLNVWVLIILMLVVAGINMVSGLLVIILERTQMIGILKALGQTNFSVRKVFLYLSGFLAMRGLLWGNLIGIGLCAIQLLTGALRLDPASYYLDTVPVLLQIWPIALLNVGTLVAIVSMLILPTLFISKISPVEAIRFE
jgi:lipoprotein-releasing system permease protein